MSETSLSGLCGNHPTPLKHPLFQCSWDRAVFLHYRVPPQFLQKQIPFELDLYDGQAYVSLVAFTLRNMRLDHPHLRFITQPLHTHAFLNVRTYVRVGERRGIYFLAEWLNNRLATMLGPTLYGLPYRFGQLAYSHNAPNLSGQVLGGMGSGTPMPVRVALRYRASLPSSPTVGPATEKTLDHFLLERYIAFTKHGPFRRLFHVWHKPWPQTAIDAQIECATLLHTTGLWFPHAQFVGANFSPGLEDVQMGLPRTL
ncbi:MAG TPA: DUF2071 domain-containing protein [Tepidisphaeraceae bacterium]|nr:DUF2071 domain-containing protein [Tepidisphaeraceae bacterium]